MLWSGRYDASVTQASSLEPPPAPPHKSEPRGRSPLPTDPRPLLAAMTAPVPHRITVDVYHRMGDLGLLSADARVQLVCGMIYEMPPIAPCHADDGTWGAEVLRKHLMRTDAQVREQYPVVLHDMSEPEPDMVLVKRRKGGYRDRHPTPDDVYLIVEVSDSTLAFDSKVKRLDYARSGIIEYWILDVRARTLIVHHRPDLEGFAEVSRLRAGDKVTLVAFPDVTIPVAEVLGETGPTG